MLLGFLLMDGWMDRVYLDLDLDLYLGFWRGWVGGRRQVGRGWVYELVAW